MTARRKISWQDKLFLNRGTVALVVGIAMGMSAKPTYQSIKNEVNRLMYSKKKEEKAPNPIRKAVLAMPSPCELREGTFLASSHEFDKFCEGGPIKERADCMSADELEKTSNAERMKDSAWMALEKVSASERARIDSNLMSEVDLEDCQEFETLPDSYKTALKELDPALYRSLKDRVYITRGHLLFVFGGAASVGGPYNLVQNGLVPSPFGRYHTLVAGDAMPDINFEEALQKDDTEKIVKFLRNVEIQAHEIYGHIFMTDKRLVDVTGRSLLRFDEMCLRGIPETAKNELHAYFVGAKMLAFMAERYPRVREILQEAYAKRENLHSLKKQRIICSEEERGLMKDLETEEALFRMAEHYEFYLKAKETGDWKPFKDMIFTKILALQFGLPYLLSYLKTHGREDCASALNEKLEAIMNNEESPEEFAKR